MAGIQLEQRQIDELLSSLNRFQREYGEIEQRLSAGEVVRLRKTHEELVRDALSGAVDGTAMGRCYLALKLPFDLLLGTLNHLKNEIVRLEAQVRAASTEEALALFASLNQRCTAAKQAAARVYLEADARQDVLLKHAQIRNKILIRICLDWLQRINRSILSDLADFPLETAKDSKFTKALRYPESLLICLDMKVCEQLQDTHRLLYQKAGILYAMLVDGRYESAYLLYRELRQSLQELLNLLSALYFESQTNRIHTFFNFIQALLYLPDTKYVCVLNLQGLGKINRLYGVEAGDRCIALLERCLEEVFERNQAWMVFSQGIAGDFYLVCYGVDTMRVEALLEDIDVCLKRRVEAEGLPYPLTVRAVGARLNDAKVLTTENMHYVIAYLTRLSRQHHGQVFDTPEDTRAMLTWIGEQYQRCVNIRDKLRSDQVEIFVQPLIRLDEEGDIHAFEILGRFRDGEGYLSAGLFIEQIIELGLVETFDRLVLEQLVAKRSLLSRLTSRVFLNVSSASLEEAEYVRFLTESIQKALAPVSVVVELTEQVLFDNMALLHRLHQDQKMIFAIDDFGIGYSSLQSVIDLALEGGVRYLKLDGSLVRRLGKRESDERIVRIIQQMAGELGLATVAEFIENASQLARLRRMEVDYGQGYLLGVPDRIETWLGKVAFLRNRQVSNDPPLFR